MEIFELCEHYLKSAEVIRKTELWSVMNLIKELGITFVTLRRIQKNPSTCSLKTLRKIKTFVDEWHFKDRASKMKLEN